MSFSSPQIQNCTFIINPQFMSPSQTQQVEKVQFTSTNDRMNRIEQSLSQVMQVLKALNQKPAQESLSLVSRKDDVTIINSNDSKINPPPPRSNSTSLTNSSEESVSSEEEDEENSIEDEMSNEETPASNSPQLTSKEEKKENPIQDSDEMDWEDTSDDSSFRPHSPGESVRSSSPETDDVEMDESN